MPVKMALVQFEMCHPEMCESGVFTAVNACPRKLITQEEPYYIPMTNPSLCKGAVTAPGYVQQRLLKFWICNLME
jgi:hypothetical protein